MNAKILIATGSLLAACGNSQLPKDSTESAETSEKEVQARGSEDAAQKQCGDECSANAEFGLFISGKDVSQWNGRKVVISAFENPQTGNGSRVVLLTGRIRYGEFSVECPKSLTENYAYPSWAAFIDVDGDGKCSPNDVGFKQQLYGWASDIRHEVPSDVWVSTDSNNPNSWLRGPLGSDAKDFCTGYFGN